MNWFFRITKGNINRRHFYLCSGFILPPLKHLKEVQSEASNLEMDDYLEYGLLRNQRQNNHLQNMNISLQEKLLHCHSVHSLGLGEEQCPQTGPFVRDSDSLWSNNNRDLLRLHSMADTLLKDHKNAKDVAYLLNNHFHCLQEHHYKLEQL